MLSTIFNDFLSQSIIYLLINLYLITSFFTVAHIHCVYFQWVFNEYSFIEYIFIEFILNNILVCLQHKESVVEIRGTEENLLFHNKDIFIHKKILKAF